MKRPGEHLRVNFGKSPFAFAIDRLMLEERRLVAAEIAKADASSLRKSDNEDSLIHNLVGQYLAHEGYVETSKAFYRDVRQRQQSLQDDSQAPPALLVSSDADDIHAINRQKIRKTILDGDIDRALKYTSSYFPHVLQEERNRDIYFQLKCRKFIEMMRRYAELNNATPSPVAKSKILDSAGHRPGVAAGLKNHGDEHDYDEDTEDADLGEDDEEDGADEGDGEDDGVPDTQMELDDQLHREASRSLTLPGNTEDIDMDASQELPPKLSLMKASELISHALMYGQELQAEFGADKRPATQKALQDIFALVAYSSVGDSPVSHLFDTQARVGIAERVNGAILGKLQCFAAAW